MIVSEKVNLTVNFGEECFKLDGTLIDGQFNGNYELEKDGAVAHTDTFSCD